MATELPGEPVAPLSMSGLKDQANSYDAILDQLVEVQVLVDVDAVHGDPDRVALERRLASSPGTASTGQVSRADDSDLLVDQPVRHRLAGTGAALVVLVVELLPELAVAGVEEDGIALPGLAQAGHAQGAHHVVQGDDVVDGQPIEALVAGDVEEDAAREEGPAVVDAELLESIGAAHLLLGEAVVVADLGADLVADVTEPVELRADLPDLAAEHLVVVVEDVGSERARRSAHRGW